MVLEEKELKEFCTFKPKISPMRSKIVSARNSKIVKSLIGGNKPPKQKVKKVKKPVLSPRQTVSPGKAITPRVTSTNKIADPKN